MSLPHLVIIGFGPVAGYKYVRLIRHAIEAGTIGGYSVLDLQSERGSVEDRIQGLPIQPTILQFLDPAEAANPLKSLQQLSKMIGTDSPAPLRVLIATEARAHEGYIDACLEQRWDFCVTKPVVVPFAASEYRYDEIARRVTDLARRSENALTSPAVLCLGRLHAVYEHGLRSKLYALVAKQQAPMTSLHVHTFSGVWNLPGEFGTREDHPYKFGYGMLQHGAYHYVDILARFLLLNRIVFPDEVFTLRLCGYAMGPWDQALRAPRDVMERLAGFKEHMAQMPPGDYGETDITGVFILEVDGRKVTTGSVTLEQTSPSIRTWAEFPDIPYNINGRAHSTRVLGTVGFLGSVEGTVVKFPVGARRTEADLRGQNFGRITTRLNAGLLHAQEYFHEETMSRPYGNSFSYEAEGEIYRRWLCGERHFSSLTSHVPTAHLLQALETIAREPGRELTIDFSFESPPEPESSVFEPLIEEHYARAPTDPYTPFAE